MKTKEMIERIYGRSQTLCLTLCAMMFASNALADSPLSYFLNKDATHFSYDSSTQTYTLLADVDLGAEFEIDKDYKFDLRGHQFSLWYSDGATGSDYTLEFHNTASNVGNIFSDCIGGGFVIGSGVKMGLITRVGVRYLEVQSGGMVSGAGLVCDETATSQSDMQSYCSVFLMDGCQVVLQPGAKIGQQGLEDGYNYQHYMNTLKSLYGINWGGWVDMTRKFLPEGYIFVGPDADGYYTVAPRFEEVVKDEKEFDIDTRTSPRNVELASEIFPFAHRVNGWGAGSAEQATITYTFNGGASQTLGSYADEDAAVWKPAKNGTYVFTHQPGGLTSTFNVQIPTVTLLSAQQRYPWNGWLDYTYSLEGLSSDKTYELVAKMTVGGVTKAATNELTSAEATDGNHAGKVNLNDYFSADAVDRSSKLKLQLLEVK